MFYPTKPGSAALQDRLRKSGNLLNLDAVDTSKVQMKFSSVNEPLSALEINNRIKNLMSLDPIRRTNNSSRRIVYSNRDRSMKIELLRQRWEKD